VNIHGHPVWTGHRLRKLWIFSGVLLALLIVLAIFDAWTVIVPTMIVSAPLLAAYFIAPEKGKVWAYFGSRPIPWWVMTWFIAVAVTLTVVGTFFRGPGWSWVWPWR
jgi:lysylphosphatidylglycerol synthetase-like protein (DUF2156 family)